MADKTNNNSVFYDFFGQFQYHDGADNNVNNKKIYENIYNKSKNELKKIIDSEVLKSKRFLITVETATVYDKMNGNYRIYDKTLAKSSKVHPILGPIGIRSWTVPFNKPVLIHHNEESDAIGRILYATIDEDTNYVGGYVSDPEAIEKILDKRYYSKSVGFYMVEPKCSICGSDIELGFFSSRCTGNKQKPNKDGEVIHHEMGQKYGDEVAGVRCGQIYKEISYVNTPATASSKVEYYKFFGDELNTDQAPANFDLVDGWANNNIVLFEYDKDFKIYVPDGDYNYQDNTQQHDSNINNKGDNMGNDQKQDNVMLSLVDLIKGLESKVDTISTAIDNMQKALKDEVTQKDNIISDLKVKVDSANERITQLISENDSLRKDKLIQNINRKIAEFPEIGDKSISGSALDEMSIEDLEKCEAGIDFIISKKGAPSDSKSNDKPQDQIQDTKTNQDQTKTNTDDQKNDKFEPKIKDVKSVKNSDDVTDNIKKQDNSYTNYRKILLRK